MLSGNGSWARDLVAALGLEGQHVTEVTIHVAADAPVMVTVVLTAKPKLTEIDLAALKDAKLKVVEGPILVQKEVE